MLTISILGCSQDNATEIANVLPAETFAPTSVKIEIKETKFKVPPTVQLRPLNFKIENDKDGIVEFFMNNPSLNDKSLEVDLAVRVPSGIYIYGGDGMSGGAGTVEGHFSVPPGSSRIITLKIKGSKNGDYPVHFSGMYWPDGDKEKWTQINLNTSFEISRKYYG